MIALIAAVLLGASFAPESVSFDCDGVRIAGRPSGRCEDKLGRFVAAQAGPVVGGRRTIAVRYEPEWGTNLYRERVALLEKGGGGYRIVWSHDLIVASAGLPGVPDRATVYVWNTNHQGDRITVSGSRTVGHISNIRTGESKGPRMQVARETYCIAASIAKFQPCRRRSA